MDELSKRRKWRRWLEMVEAEIGRLRKDMRIYAEIHQHLADNPDWSAWLENAYLVGVSLTIRRLVDANPRHRTVPWSSFCGTWRHTPSVCRDELPCVLLEPLGVKRLIAFLTTWQAREHRISRRG